MQYAGFEAQTVKHEPLRCIYLMSRLLNWVYNFAVRALEDANRLITDSKSRLRTRLLSIAMRHKALIRHSCTSFVLNRRQHRKRPLSAAISNRHTEIDISGPKVVENFRYIGRSGPHRGPRALRLHPHQPHGWSGPAPETPQKNRGWQTYIIDISAPSQWNQWRSVNHYKLSLTWHCSNQNEHYGNSSNKTFNADVRCQRLRIELSRAQNKNQLIHVYVVNTVIVA